VQQGWHLEANELRAGPNARLRRNALSRLIAEESVQHLDDLVFRRTTLWEDPEGTASAAGELALLFGWGPSRAEQERSRLSLRLATMCAPVGRRPGFAEVADPAIVLEKKKA
jgi:glycerol-3-phosphate dehydrogenase